MFRKEKEVELPQTESALDDFVLQITLEFDLPSGDDTYDAIATAILHFPQDRAYAKKSFFANKVKKMIANQMAYKKCIEFGEKRKVIEEEKKKIALSLVPNQENPSDNGEKPLQNA